MYPFLHLSCLQLHRLTWWSRHSQEPRIDLMDAWMTSNRVNPEPSSDSDQVQHTWWKRAALWLCGLTGPTSEPQSPGTENKLISLKEEPLWRTICNVNALLLLTINVFLWGYFA